MYFLNNHDFYAKNLKIWLYDVVNVRLEGVIIGFDEYMNLVLDDVEELNVKVWKIQIVQKFCL